MANSAVVGILRALLTADTASFDSAMKRSADTAKAFSKDLNTFGQQASRLGASLTKTLTLPIVGLGAASIKAFTDFESSFAGVRKTVDASESEFKVMEQSFRNLSKQIPVNVNELNRLGEAAGALGIPKEEIVDFARVMALLGVTTNLTSDQAAEGIAKIQNIFGAAGKDTEQFASTIVALGNAGASTETQILEMATRIAGAGNAVGMTQGQVLGFASALSSVGIEAEMGGSAISRVFIDIAKAVGEGGEAVEGFAAVSGMSVAKFSKLFKDDAAAATQAFIAGLGRVKAAGGDLIGTLEALGFSEIRVRDTLLRTAGAGDLLTKALDLQGTAWRDNTALTIEAEKRFAVTEERLKVLWNRIKDVGITLGNALLPAVNLVIAATDKFIPLLEGVADGFAKLPSGLQLTIVGLAGVTALAGPLIFLLGQLAISAAAVTGAFAAKGVATAVLGGKLAGLTATLALLAAKAAAVVGVGFAGWNVGKWIGEASGLTDAYEKLFGKLMGLTDAEIAAGMAARKHSEAMKAQNEAAKTASGEIDIAAATTRAFADAQRQSEEAAKKAAAENKKLTEWMDKNSEATDKAKKAAKELEEQVNKERAALAAMGIVTERDVNEQLAAFEQLEKRATAEGVSMKTLLTAIVPKLQELADKAKASGIQVAGLAETLKDASTELHRLQGGTPTLSVGPLLEVTGAAELLGAEFLDASRNAALLNNATAVLGVQSRSELEQIAKGARQAYEDMLDSGQFTADELIEALEKVKAAEAKARGQSIPAWKAYWKQYADFAKSTLRDVERALAETLLGMSGVTAKEHQRISDDATKTYEDTQERQAETLADTQKRARKSYADTERRAIESYDRATQAAKDNYNEILVKDGVTKEELIKAENRYYHEMKVAADEKDAAIAAAHAEMTADITEASEKSNTEIAESYDAMLKANEEASHRWRDNLNDIWGFIKQDFMDVVSAMLSDFIHRGLTGMLNAVLGSRGGFASAFAGIFGGGGGGAGGVGGGGSLFAGLGKAAGSIFGNSFVGAALTTLAVLGGAIGLLNWIGGGSAPRDSPQDPVVDPNTGQVVYDPNQPNNPTPGWDPGNPGQGNPNWDGTFGMPQLQGGTHGTAPNWGTGTPVMLHGREDVVPYGERLAFGGGAGGASGAPMTVVFEMDRRRFAEEIIEYIPGALKRFKLV